MGKVRKSITGKGSIEWVRGRWRLTLVLGHRVTAEIIFRHRAKDQTSLWSKKAKNTDCSNGPLARPFARSLATLTRLLAPDCSLHSRPPLRSLIHSLAHFAHSLARGKEAFCMKWTRRLHTVSTHCGMLGYSRGIAETSGAFTGEPLFGQGSGPMWIDDLQCIGTESDINDCRFSTDTGDCSHREDAGVICSEPIQSWRAEK